MSAVLLDKNENPYGLSPQCREVLDNISNELIGNYTRNGHSRLYGSIEETFGVPREKIVFGYGCEGILKQLSYMAFGQNASVMIPRQSWDYYSVLADEIKARPVYYDLREEEDAFVYDTDALVEGVQRHRPDVLIISSPNNPTGNGMSYDDLKRVLEAGSGTTVVLDEAYWGFEEGDAREIGGLLKKYSNLIVLRSFSKFFAMAGLRIGYAFFGGEASSWVKFNSRYLGFNRISERLIICAIDNLEYYRGVAEKIAREKERYYRELTTAGFKPFRSAANFILARVPEGTMDNIERELREKEIILKYYREEPFAGCIRLAIGTEEQNRLVLDSIRNTLSVSAAGA